MIKNKLIIGIDHELWIDFVAKCKKDGVKIVCKLTDLIRGELDGKNK